jgi:hypothetical protein
MVIALMAALACTRITDADIDAKLGIATDNGVDDTAVEDTRPINEEELAPGDVVQTLFGAMDLDFETSAGPFTCPGSARFPHDGDRFTGDGDCELTLDGTGSGYRIRVRWYGYLESNLVTRGVVRLAFAGDGDCASLSDTQVSGKLAVGSALDVSGKVDTRACQDLGATLDLDGTVTFDGAQ